MDVCLSPSNAGRGPSGPLGFALPGGGQSAAGGADRAASIPGHAGPRVSPCDAPRTTNLLDPVDEALLVAVQDALRLPFADPVTLVEGNRHRRISRRDARSMERMLLKLKGRV